MTVLIFALGLVFVIEGLLYALFPGAMKNMMKFVIEQQDSAIRLAGLLSATIGVFIIYMVK